MGKDLGAGKRKFTAILPGTGSQSHFGKDGPGTGNRDLGCFETCGCGVQKQAKKHSLHDLIGLSSVKPPDFFAAYQVARIVSCSCQDSNRCRKWLLPGWKFISGQRGSRDIQLASRILHSCHSGSRQSCSAWSRSMLGGRERNHSSIESQRGYVSNRSIVEHIDFISQWGD